MLAALQTTPRSEQEWSWWSLQNKDCIDQIRAAILAQRNIRLPEYPLDPIPFQDLVTWLNNNQQAHLDFTNALGQQSNDLLHTNFNDPGELQSWVYLNWMELVNACATLRIGP